MKFVGIFGLVAAALAGLAAVLATSAFIRSHEKIVNTTTTIAQAKPVIVFKEPKFGTYADTFESESNAYATEHSKPVMHQANCVPSPDKKHPFDHACSYIVSGQCRFATLTQKTDGVLHVHTAGKVPLPIKHCFIRDVFAYYGSAN